jgi:acyl carrier protein
MNPQLEQAIKSFIANEFKLSGLDLDDPDFSFAEELGLNLSQIEDFLNRLQESLGISIPEDKLSQIQTLGDLYSALNNEDDFSS